MRLVGADGFGVELHVDGYQFADDPRPDVRRSWLMIAGSAYSPEGSWAFRWQALGPDDAAALSHWLREVAAGRLPDYSHHDGLSFTEPNLAVTLLAHDPPDVVLRFAFDLEFSPPWRFRTRCGDPFEVTCRLPATALVSAVDGWDRELAALH